MQLLALLISALLVGLTVWWFFGKKSSEQTVRAAGKLQHAAVLVDGGYRPEVTRLQKGVPIHLTFVRKDASGCLEEVIFPDFGIRQKLSLKAATVIAIPELPPGEYEYSCGMRMYYGKLVVE